MSYAFILSCVRSPIAKAGKGAFALTRIDDIAEQVLRAAVFRVPGLDPSSIEDVLVGCAMPEGEQGYNVARNVALLAGLPQTSGAVTINRLCASSMEALAQAARAIGAGDGEAFVVGGMESMSHVPMSGFNPSFNERLMREGAPAAYVSMGITAENVAARYSVSRIEQDRFALMSHRKAIAAQDRGAFDAEIVPVRAERDSGVEPVSKDECPRGDTSEEALAGLAPAFLQGGSVTAGNSSPLSDGAAMAVLSSKSFAKRSGAQPLARIRSIAVAGVAPELMGMGPAAAVPKALARARMKLRDIDVIEINEAFAAQAIAVIRELGADEAKVNVSGGAIALGHPLGMSGLRIVITLAHEMNARGASTGLAAMCVGGGQGMAVVLEKP